jgi:hypothetical protein
MNTRQIRIARIQLQHAGSPANQKHDKAILIRRAKDDLEKLCKGMATLAAEFRRSLTAWRTELVSNTIVPFILLDQIRRANLYTFAGVFAICAELGLAAWIFHRLRVAWWYGGVAALLITGLVHGVLHLLTHQEDRPKRSEFLATRYAAAPAFALFLAAVAFGTLARYVYGWAVLLLLPLFNAALWIGTFSLMILSGALFTIAYILYWSRRYTRHYQGLDREFSETNAFLDELSGTDDGAKPTAPLSTPPRLGPPSLSEDQISIGRSAAMMLLAFLIATAVGCSTVSTQADTTPGPASLRPVPETCLTLIFDRTGSPEELAVKEAWTNIKRGLPAIVEDLNITCLTVYAFDGDGWQLTTLQDFPLPTPNVNRSTDQTVDGTEWQDFGNVDAALKEVRQDREHKMLVMYRIQLQKALRPLESLHVSSEGRHEAKASDVIGLFRHISHEKAGRRIFILITDVADSQYKDELPEIQPPPPGISALVLIVPAKQKDCVLTLGRKFSGAEQFLIRSEQLHHSVSWLKVVPYFERNIEDQIR